MSHSDMTMYSHATILGVLLGQINSYFYTLKPLCSYVNSIGFYYKQFIKSYYVITAPLQELLKKSVHFRWGDEQEQAFINLKDALCKAPVLAYPDPDAPYVMDTDASNLAIGVVLSQVQDGEEKVIMYGSKAFYGSQRRRERFAIIHFVKVKFSYYLLNQEFTLRTDHSLLRWLDDGCIFWNLSDRT